VSQASLLSLPNFWLRSVRGDHVPANKATAAVGAGPAFHGESASQCQGSDRWFEAISERDEDVLDAGGRQGPLGEELARSMALSVSTTQKSA